MFTIVSGQTFTPVATLEAPTALDAAISGHREFLTDSKLPVDGFEYDERGPNYGKPAHRDWGNGAQSLDDCLLVFAGEYAEGHEFNRNTDALKAVVRVIEPKSDGWN